ncbi:nitrite reductase large subunit NirB [Deinococcus deserti]|uniref:Putative nitrite reductase (NAD(P)H), large subunit n=1 Tax=Deinococcus deserti (strain DSM 17065 / CIP 109153 / LMG 22923 / VCD115) TaxID=546414 RepID=C1CX86_DEIDV|nr:nitrite reductase large subunit NirB [Deinococcus deserti]ACO46803.1 putative nitrite reductase (NAD(P)H), large subunit [Deinococcus deserti VCD115]
MSTSPVPHLVIIGNGMVGHRLVDGLRAQVSGQELQITVISEESRLAYDRVQLSRHFDDPRPDLSLATEAGYAELEVQVVRGRADALDPAAKVVQVGTQQLAYDALVMATGSVPFVPPIAGRDAPGCFVYRTLDDLDAIRDAAQGARRGVVIGGGLLGLEAAGALRKLGLETHVVEFAPQLMPAQLDAEGGQTLQRIIEAKGIGVHTARATSAVATGMDDRVTGLVFTDGTALEADLVVFSAGIRPRDDLARACGLTVGERGGIQIDDSCRTSDPHIYAVGECALHGGRIYGLVAPGYQMARVAAAHLLADLGLGGDRTARFTGADLSTRLKLLGVEVGSFGDAHGRTPGARSVSLSDNVRGTYSKVVLSPDAQVLGGLLVGDTSRYGELLDLVLSGTPLQVPPETLIVPSLPAGAAAAPTNALVCSCENVRANALCAAVGQGARDVASLKECTGAGTGCGGCVPSLHSLLHQELTRLGETVTNHLCEHYPHSRQELFDLIRVRGYRTWDEVLRSHGHELGCEVCKPAVASILASLHGEHILNPAHAPLQDTNDAFLANIQKNGTYSVVPRVPGGEITADGLIAIGQVARKYGLYCKITGGQRIDLLGAQRDDLPAIWTELIAAGFESGHAYGKSLRTIKSCVGQTWCRYGVQDSTSLAVRLELRYRGLRSPHKLKSGVSGCTRECAEARSKDFGIIATEKGWNVYVGGNGGVTPKHAVLLASDLPEAEVITLLDRFLMFYIRTADRLQRTSTWLEQLDGGVEYLRGVLLEDRLGLCAELDEAMRQHVGTYRDEWATTLADPAQVARFRTFVNSDARDDGVQWVDERGQIRPADLHMLTPLPMAGGTD